MSSDPNPVLGTETVSTRLAPLANDPTPTEAEASGTGSDVSPLPETGCRYRLGNEIARGGMGAVLHAHDAVLGRDLAVKLLLPEHRQHADLLHRFFEEAHVGGQLQHPGVVPVHDLGVLPDGRPFIAMKLVQGVTLSELLKKRPDPMHDLPRFVAIFQQVCQTIAYAHANKVLHRDLKPANVMVGAFGEVQVMDWGLAKRLPGKDEGGRMKDEKDQTPSSSSFILHPSSFQKTQPGTVVGTWAYMAPEQARGEVETLDERADVFGLGAILCEILTGLPPYAGPSPVVVRDLALRADLEVALAWLDGSEADAELIALARRCLAVDPAARPRDAGAVAAAVSQYLAGATERLRRAEVERAEAEARAEAEMRERQAAQAKAMAERRARWLTIWLAGAGLLLILGGVAVAFWLNQVHRERQAAAAAAERAIEADLDKADLLSQQQQWSEALAMVERSERLPHDTLSETLRQRLRRTRTDLQLLARLEEIRAERATVNYPARDRDYGEAFKTLCDLDLTALSADEAARRLLASPVRVQLIPFLDDWAYIRDRRLNQAGRDQLLRLAQNGDAEDTWRRRFRQALLANDAAEVRQLARQAPLDRLPPATLLLLSRALPPTANQQDQIDLLEQAQRHQPNDFWINLELGRVYSSARPSRHVEALRSYSIAVALRPHNASVLHDQANAYHLLRRFDEAVATYRRALEIKPDFLLAWTNLSEALRRQNKLQEAEVAARQAVQLDPNFFGGHFALAQVLYDQNRFVEAHAAYRQAWELDQKQSQLDPKQARLDQRHAQVLYGLGLVLNALHSYAEAEKVLQQAAERNARDPDVWYQWGIALMELGRRTEAREAFQKTIELRPTAFQAHTRLGRLLVRLGHLSDGLATLRRSQALAQQQGQVNPRLTQEIRLVEQLVALEKVLPAVLKKERAVAPGELLGFAQICLFTKRPATAVRFYALAFVADRSLLSNSAYPAAVSAALAAVGSGEDAGQLDEAERRRLRNQAYEWLRVELEHWTRSAEPRNPDRGQIVRPLRQLQLDPELASVRDSTELDKLPETERPKWRKLWSDVNALLQRVQKAP